MVLDLVNARVAIYARFSSDKQSDASIEDQVTRARELVRAHHGDPDLARVFTDFAISGASMDRPGMRALEDAIRSRSLDVLITESVDRLSRHAAGAMSFGDSLTQHSVALVCLDGTRLGAGGEAIRCFARNPAMPKARRTFMLSGLLHCALCGARMQRTHAAQRRLHTALFRMLPRAEARHLLEPQERPDRERTIRGSSDDSP